MSPSRVPRGTPSFTLRRPISLNTDEKEAERREGDDTNSNVSAGPPDPRPPDGLVGPPTLFHRKLRQKMPWIQLLVPRLRLQDRMPLDIRAWFPSGGDETAVPCPTDHGSQPPNRTSFSTSFKIYSGVYRIYPKSTQRAYGSDEQRPTSGIRKGEFDQTTFLCARSSSPIYIRGYLFFSSHPPPRGALELELRRCRHTGGLQRSMDTITSHIPYPPAPLAIPERRTRRIKRLAPPDRRPFQARGQFADDVNSHPDVAHGDSQPHPIGRGVKTSHPTYSRIPLEQFAENVNSHPTLLGHGNPHADPNRQSGRGKILGSQRSASQVINHRTISRSRQAQHGQR